MAHQRVAVPSVPPVNEKSKPEPVTKHKVISAATHHVTTAKTGVPVRSLSNDSQDLSKSRPLPLLEQQGETPHNSRAQPAMAPSPPSISGIPSPPFATSQSPAADKLSPYTSTAAKASLPSVHPLTSPPPLSSNTPPTLPTPVSVPPPLPMTSHVAEPPSLQPNLYPSLRLPQEEPELSKRPPPPLLSPTPARPVESPVMHMAAKTPLAEVHRPKAPAPGLPKLVPASLPMKRRPSRLVETIMHYREIKKGFNHIVALLSLKARRLARSYFRRWKRRV